MAEKQFPLVAVIVFSILSVGMGATVGFAANDAVFGFIVCVIMSLISVVVLEIMRRLFPNLKL